MNNLFVTISDVHFCLKNLAVAETVLRQALEQARKLNVPLFSAGDLHDTKSIIRAEEVIVLLNIFNEYKDVPCYLLIGNHEKINKNSDGHALEFLRELSNITLIDSAIALESFPGFKIIPYQKTKSNFISEIQLAKQEGYKRILAHQGVCGSFMGDYCVDDSSVDPIEFNGFDFVGLGHYHQHQKFDTHMYWGSAFTVNFGEAGHDKFIWVVSETEGKIHTQPISTRVRAHRQYTFTNELPEGKQVAELRDDDLIKIILKGTKEFCLQDHSKWIKHNYPTQSVTIVPDIIRQSEHRISQDIVHKPVLVIEKYLEGATTDFDKEKLKAHLWTVVADVLNNLSNSVRKKFKVVRAEAQNFLSYEELNYDYEAKGLTLIEGHDEDFDISTGAGKSSFLDVSCYGLFGKTSKKLKADEVINRKIGKNMIVKTYLKTDSGNMEVIRYRNHKDFENDFYFTYAGQNEPIRGKDNLETQKLLEKELGLDFDMFLRSSYFTQFGNIDRFLSAPDSEKKQIISEICDTKIYDEMVVALKQAAKDFSKEYGELENKFIAKNSECDTRQSNLATLKTQSEECIKQQLLKGEELQKQSNSWVNDKIVDLELLQQYSENFEADKQIRLTAAHKKIFDYDKSQGEIIKNLELQLEEKQTQLSEQSAKAIKPEPVTTADEKLQIQNKLNIVEQLNNESIKMQCDINNKETIILQHKGNIHSLGEFLTTPNCITCNQPISKEHVDKQIKQIQLKIDNNDREKRIIYAKKSDIVRSMEAKEGLEIRMREILSLESEYTVKLSQYQDYIRMADSTKVAIKQLKFDINNRPANPHYELHTSIKAETNGFLSQIENKNAEVNPFIVQLRTHVNTSNPFTSMIKEEELKVTTSNNERKLLISERDTLQEKIDYTNWWKDAIHIYIKSYLTDSFIEQMNTLANAILTQKFDGMLSIHISATNQVKKATKEKITVVVYNNGEECSYNSLSGGERCRICFALNIAIAAATGINFGFIMFDEILNGLDDVGKNQVMKVLKELEARYESIFMIDHTTEFKSLFTNTILIKKSNGISRVV